MFLFCGVFYPIESLPQPLPWLAWALPLTPVNSVMRSLSVGFPFEPWSLVLIAAWLVPLVLLSRQAMLARLVK
jgi:lipooligosaccharide transport system permease protein